MMVFITFCHILACKFLDNKSKKKVNHTIDSNFINWKYHFDATHHFSRVSMRHEIIIKSIKNTHNVLENFNWSHILELELVYWHGYHISIPKWCGCVVWPDSGHCIMTAYLQCIGAWLWWGSFMVRRRPTWSGRALAQASRQPLNPAGWRTVWTALQSSGRRVVCLS